MHNDHITVSVDTPDSASSQDGVEEPVCCDDVSPEFVAHMSALNQIICSQSTGIAISAKICINMEGLYADYCEINTIWYNTVNDLVRGMTSGKKLTMSVLVLVLVVVMVMMITKRKLLVTIMMLIMVMMTHLPMIVMEAPVLALMRL